MTPHSLQESHLWHGFQGHVTGGPWVVTFCCDSLIWPFADAIPLARHAFACSPISLATLILQGQLYLGSLLLMLIFVARFLLMIVRLSNCSHGLSTKATPTLPPMPLGLVTGGKYLPC